MGPLVMYILDPVMIQLLPSLIARVWMPAASEPALGSVRQNAAIFLPAARSGIQRFFCSSLPPK